MAWWWGNVCIYLLIYLLIALVASRVALYWWCRSRPGYLSDHLDGIVAGLIWPLIVVFAPLDLFMHCVLRPIIMVVRRGEDTSLDHHLAWLKRNGASDVDHCVCDYALRGGVLYGMHMAKSWVRLRDHPNCPTHGSTRAPSDAEKRGGYPSQGIVDQGNLP